MSGEIYELMKRADEAAVVEQAHRRPQSVEDCVREMIREPLERFPNLQDDQFLSARQVNLKPSTSTTSSQSDMARSASCGGKSRAV